MKPTTETEETNACRHTHTSNRFGGEILCQDCSRVIGWWKGPQQRISLQSDVADDEAKKAVLKHDLGATE